MPLAFTACLNHWLTRTGQTPADLAKALRVRPAVVEAWARGESAPTMAGLERVADALGVSVAEFFAGAMGGAGEVVWVGEFETGSITRRGKND